MARNTTFTQTAPCPAGKTAVGGGGSTGNANLVLMSSLPSGTGWAVRFQNTTNSNQTGALTATAVCATVLP